MELTRLFPTEPWSKVIDKLIDLGFTDETIQGSINAQRSFSLESLFGESGKVGLGFVHVIGGMPSHDDIYAYWMRLSQTRATYELRVISDETGYSKRWSFKDDPSEVLETFYRDVIIHNAEHTSKRRRGRVPRQVVRDSFEFHDRSSERNFTHPTPLLRSFLKELYNDLHLTDITSLTADQAVKVSNILKMSNINLRTLGSPLKVRRGPPEDIVYVLYTSSLLRTFGGDFYKMSQIGTNIIKEDDPRGLKDVMVLMWTNIDQAYLGAGAYQDCYGIPVETRPHKIGVIESIIIKENWAVGLNLDPTTGALSQIIDRETLDAIK